MSKEEQTTRRSRMQAGAPVVVCGFPGIGKSYVAKNFEGYYDSDSSAWSWSDSGGRHPDWPSNYVGHIKTLSGTILVSTHKEVRDALRAAGIDYWLCYPARFLKFSYVQRYKKRGSPEVFVKLLDEKWNTWMDEMDAEKDRSTHHKVILFEEEYLADVLHVFED